MIQFGISNYNSGDLPSKIDGNETDNTRQHILFQPDNVPLQPSNTQTTDIIFWNTNVLPSTRGLGNLPYGMPKIYPFGRGGFGENRIVKMRPEVYGKRCLDLHGNDFGRHWGFLAIIFDAIALSKSFLSQYLSLKVHPRAIKQGLWDKEAITECIQYTKKCEHAALRGMPVTCNLVYKNRISI
jgi:hypothetical protein